MKWNLNDSSITDLLQLRAEIWEELKRRKILRSENLTGDYAEWIASRALDLKLLPKSTKGYDAIDSKGIKYEIKGCANSSRELSAIRDIEKKCFDFLIAILFDKNHSVLEAYKIPHSIVSTYSKFDMHTSSDKVRLKGDILSTDGVERIDEQIRKAVP